MAATCFYILASDWPKSIYYSIQVQLAGLQIRSMWPTLHSFGIPRRTQSMMMAEGFTRFRSKYANVFEI